MKGLTAVALERALNFRDLGGYGSRLGGTVRENRLFRSDSHANLTPADVEAVLGLGVRAVIDLRTPLERNRDPSRLADVDKIAYLSIPLSDRMQGQSGEQTFPASMGALYVNLLDNASEAILSVFAAIWENSAAGVVFNCTAGKDRTGVIAALILDLLGVDREEIVQNYAVTARLMQPIFETMSVNFEKNMGIKLPAYILESREESIREFLDHLYARYGGARAYLTGKGFDADRAARFIETYLVKDN